MSSITYHDDEQDPEPGEKGWDPVPHLAALIDGLHACALAGEGGHEPLIRVMAGLLTGPYAALRGGLLLDIPGPDGEIYDDTETAIRVALRKTAWRQVISR